MKARAIIVLVALFAIPAASLALTNHTAFGTKISTCIKCHPLALPTHLREKPGRMTEEWPLDEKGRMLCVTCHDCTSGACTRRMEGNALCRVCHNCTTGMACLIGTAHMGDSENLEELATGGCLGCHDGGGGPNWQILGEHIVDIVYAASPVKELRPVRDKRIVLVNEKVTCLSCHNPYKSAPDYLSMSNENSRLCLTCHIK